MEQLVQVLEVWANDGPTAAMEAFERLVEPGEQHPESKTLEALRRCIAARSSQQTDRDAAIAGHIEGLTKGRHRRAPAVGGAVERRLREMTRYLKRVTRYARNLALGDFSSTLMLRDHGDALGQAMSDMTRAIQTTTHVAERVARGEVDHTVSVAGPKDRLGRALNRMVDQLADTADVALAVSRGELPEGWEPISGDDVLGSAVRAMLSTLERVQSVIERMAKGQFGRRLDENEKESALTLALNATFGEVQAKVSELVVAQARRGHAATMASLGEVASGLAHEINSPLLEVNLAAQRIGRLSERALSGSGRLSPQQLLERIREAATHQVRAIERATTIINSMRAISRDGAQDPFSVTAPADIVQDATGLLEERFRIQAIQFAVQYGEGAADRSLICRRVQISQVLVNLINNAHDAVAQTDTEQWIRLDVTTEGDQIVFGVEDSGGGVEASMREKIFEPLFTTKPVGHGTGLGLSISADIATSHGGTLGLCAVRHDGGTRFELKLPWRGADDVAVSEER